MLFELPETTECTLTTFTGRTEKRGPEDVPAVSFRLKLAGTSNLLLDRFSKTIRHTVYKAVEGQDQLPGMEGDITPLLQSKDLTEWAPDTCLEGWTVMLSRGIDDSSGLQMGSCKVDDFRFTFFEGGRMDVDFRVGTADVDESGAGMLWGRQKRKVFVIIRAPEMPKGSDGATIDGTKGHPGMAAAKAAEAERQGDLLAGSDGAAVENDGSPWGPAGGDRHAGDFGQADDDSAGPGAGSSDDVTAGEAQRGDGWPFPQDADGGADSEGGETDSAGDVAEFEAGAKAALAKAGVAARRSRKTRAGVE